MNEKFERDLMRGSLDLMVLAVLAERPDYGYAIQARLRDATAERVRLQAGTLYPLLHRLEADGAIRSKWDDQSGRPRKWYELTASGRKRLNQQAGQWRQYVQCVTRLLPQLTTDAGPGPAAEADLA